ncbi:hypothetical protein HDV02_002250 [Globomyces sp. JEL0801]|nr:hypothetical protein HDV02_002250 [Globomyces sp. JEL0801]
MKCFEFIFLARVWKKDQDRIVDNLVRAKNDKNPMWLLVFPEGTVITEGTKANSRAYAKKKDITDEPKHVLLPKSTGLYHILRALESDTEYLYDFTMGKLSYSGLTKDSIPYDAYPPSLVFFKGQGPQAIHIHVDRIKIADIPGLPKQPYSKSESATEEFDVWLRKRFMVKDELMKAVAHEGHDHEAPAPAPPAPAPPAPAPPAPAPPAPAPPAPAPPAPAPPAPAPPAPAPPAAPQAPVPQAPAAPKITTTTTTGGSTTPGYSTPGVYDAKPTGAYGVVANGANKETFLSTLAALIFIALV